MYIENRNCGESMNRMCTVAMSGSPKGCCNYRGGCSSLSKCHWCNWMGIEEGGRKAKRDIEGGWHQVEGSKERDASKRRKDDVIPQLFERPGCEHMCVLQEENLIEKDINSVHLKPSTLVQLLVFPRSF